MNKNDKNDKRFYVATALKGGVSKKLKNKIKNKKNWLFVVNIKIKNFIFILCFHFNLVILKNEYLLQNLY